MDEVIQQLSKYLQQTDENLLEKATELCKGQTFPILIPHLLKLTSHSNSKISENSLISLIYMTSNINESRKQLIQLGAVNRLMESVISGSNSNINQRLMLLTNLTTENEACIQLLDLKDPELKGQKLLRLAIRFSNPPESLDIPKTEFIKGLPVKASNIIGDEYQYAAHVLMNATLIKEGRDIFYENPKFFMPSFLDAISSSNPIRKQGIIGVIRNLCFESEKHDFLINKVKILPHIIKPLIPKSIEDNLTATEMLQKSFPVSNFQGLEPLAENRKNLLETIWLLTQSEIGKEFLIKNHIIFILRELEAEEDNEENKDLAVRIGALLLGPDENNK